MRKNLYLDLLNRMYVSTGRMIGILDESPVVIFCDVASPIRNFTGPVLRSLSKDSKHFIYDGYTVCSLTNDRTSFVLVEGTDEIAVQLCNVLSVMFFDLKRTYEEKYDSGNFLKEIILKPELPEDLQLVAKMLKLDPDAEYTVAVFHFNSVHDISVSGIISGIHYDDRIDVLFDISESYSVLVKSSRKDSATMDESIAIITKALENECLTAVGIGIGTPVSGLDKIKQSYQEAITALKIGTVFDAEHTVFHYNNLGIARLISELSPDVCETFLKEVFPYGAEKNLDFWVLTTIRAFFLNDCNISETSRKLFIHRNTLVYRMNKIQAITGLDLKRFDHAIILKIALMIINHLEWIKGTHETVE